MLRLQSEPFAPGAALDAFVAAHPGAGAVVSFTGHVRDEGGRLVALEIEHYPGMARRAIETQMAEARARWGLSGVQVIHRFGTIPAGGPIVMVATAAPHRAAAFEAAEFLMDHLKSRAPFWKREITPEGPGPWVEARATDEGALDRWR